MLPNFVKADILKGALKKVAGDNDTKTTVLGYTASGILASQIDWGKLLQGDHNQIGLLIGTIIVAVFGYYTNKGGNNGQPKPTDKPSEPEPGK